MNVSGRLNGVDVVTRKLTNLSASIESMVARVVMTFSLQLTARVKMKLSDDVLRVRTGRLRRSIHNELTVEPGKVTGTVGTNVEYARRHEMGFTGTEQVRASMRMQVKAWGKTMKNPRMVAVKGFERKVSVTERSFLRSSLSELGPDLPKALEREFGATATAIFS
jgi:phage gpG-like protein